MTTQSEGGKINRTGRPSLRNLAEFNWGRALRATALLASMMALCAQGARAQDDELFTDGSGKGFTPQSGPTCSGGTAVDDGSIEQGYRLAAADARVVQRLTPPSYPAKLTRVCACWLSNDDNVSASFNFLIYDDDGPSG
ncbi:MAG TPA: hypothetical protein VN783_11305, partial [Thermoanaerobaculia bacterium]|nr:hypothetical protein [Thermoanaerobaculia bacterium]